MKCSVIFPPGIRPLMPSRNVGSIAGILKDIFRTVDVIDVNSYFFNKIYKNELQLYMDNDIQVLKSENIEKCIKTFKSIELLSEDSYKSITNEISIRSFLLSNIISDLNFGLFAVQLKNENQLGRMLRNHVFHPALKQLVNELLSSEKYDFVVINIETYKQVYFAALIAELLHARSSGKILVSGEYVNSLIEEELVSELQTYFDYVVDIDYQKGVFRVYEWSKINACVKPDGNDEQPVQSYEFNEDSNNRSDLFDINFFSDDSYFYMFPKYPIRLSIGCCHGKCKFCIQNKRAHKSLQVFSVSKLVSEIMEADNEKYSFFEFVDVNVHAKQLLQFATMISENNLNVKWVANTRLYEELLRLDNCELLAKAGCKKLFIGFESYNQEILDACGKGIQTGHMKTLLNNLKASGIATHISFLFGVPGETERQAENTRNFIIENLELIDIAEINRYIEHDKEKINKDDYNVNQYVLELRKLLENNGKTASYFNIFTKIR